MSTVTINQFNGGLAEDVRELKTNTFAVSKNFDIFSNNYLKPYRITETEGVATGTLANFKFTDAVVHTPSSGYTNKNIFALGQAGVGDANGKLFEKGTVGSITANFDVATNGEATTYNVIPQSLISFKQKLYFLSTDLTNTYLHQYNRATTTLSTIAGSIASYPTNLSNAPVPKPFIHPQSGRMYIASGGKLSSFDGTTLTSDPITIPNADESVITSMCDYGGYLAIAVISKNEGNPSKVILWDMTSSLINDTIDFGEGALMLIENLNGAIVGLSSVSTGGTSNFSITPRLVMRGYAGGAVSSLKEFNTSDLVLRNFKAKQNNKLYFACKMVIQGVTVHQLWVCGQNRDGNWFLSPDRFINNDTAITSIDGFNLIEDFMWAGFNGDGSFYRTRYTSATFTSSSIYESLINHGMAVSDRTKKKKLLAISVARANTSGTVTLKYRVDSESSGDWVTICSFTTGLNIKAVNESTGTPFLDGYEYQFRLESTSGACPMEIKYEYETLPELI